MDNEQNFRANLSQFRWARDQQQQQSSEATASANPFSRIYNSVSGYVPLRSAEHTNEEEAYFALSRWERYANQSLMAETTLKEDRQATRVSGLLIRRRSLLYGWVRS